VAKPERLGTIETVTLRRWFLMRKLIASVLVLAAAVVPLASSEVTVDAANVPLCSASQISVSLGATQRWTLAKPMRGDLVSLTAIDFTNHGPTCQLARSGPSVRFRWMPNTSVSTALQRTAAVAARASRGLLPLKRGKTDTLNLFVRGAASTQQACHPVTAAAIEVSGVDGAAGWSHFSRTIAHVCTNPALQSANYGVGWQQYWVD
jgi:hypothetical protein